MECRPMDGLINSKTCELAQLQVEEGILDVGKYGQLQQEVNELLA